MLVLKSAQERPQELADKLARPSTKGAAQEPAAELAEELADRAVDALIAEAILTPKPGLVDRRGPGAHRDLDLSRLLRSAASLRDSFREMAACSGGRVPDLGLREELGALGRRAEEKMLAATGGSNAHRGAIWMLGLLVAGRAMCVESATTAGEEARKLEATRVAAVAAQLARLPDRFASGSGTSNGERVREKYGVPGARGEAQSGFPHVVNIGLPALLQARVKRRQERDQQDGYGACGGESHAQLDALMAIMAALPDTCLLHRGGLEALEAAQKGASEVIQAGGTSTVAGWRALHELDAELSRRWVSPGGSADVLAACLFLDEGDQWRS